MDRISPEGKLQTNRIPVGDLLFHSGVDAFKALLADPLWLGAEVGITVTLETWDDRMRFHPHRHSLVAGGGLTPDGKRVDVANPRCLVAVKPLTLMADMLDLCQELRKRRPNLKFEINFSRFDRFT